MDWIKVPTRLWVAWLCDAQQLRAGLFEAHSAGEIGVREKGLEMEGGERGLSDLLPVV